MIIQVVFKMKCDTPFETYSDLCDLFNEIFKTGNWGVTRTYKFDGQPSYESKLFQWQQQNNIIIVNFD